MRATLSFLLAAMAGMPASVGEPSLSEAGAPLPRPVLAPGQLLLPGHYAGQADGDPMALCRAAVAHAAAHLRHSAAAQPSGAVKPMSRAVISALEDARVERLLCRDFPGARRWFDAFVPAEPDPGDLSFPGFMRRLARVLARSALSDGDYWVEKARRLFEAQARRGLHDAQAFREVAAILANDLGQMRVRFDPSSYVEPVPYRDDGAYLWDHGRHAMPEEALSLDAGVAGRTDGRPGDGPQAMPAESGRYAYPEWDYRARRSRSGWCTVIERAPSRQPPQAMLPQAPHRIASLPCSRRLDRARRLRRQFEGDVLDLDAAVDAILDLRAGLMPDPRIFLRPGWRESTSSTLLLLDLSQSSNDTAGRAGVPVLALEKRAALMLAHSLPRGGARIAVHGFCSDTRHAVHYHRLLDFGEPLECGAGRIAAAQGRYSTRLGAALRHAGRHVREAAGERRSIMVITDGEPSDVDVFDARYLREDTRQAVAELRRADIQVHCLALDPRAEPGLRIMFGARGYRIVADAAGLPAALARCHARAMAG